MSQNGQIHFKNLAAKCCKRCVWPFWDIMHWRVKDELQEPAVSFLTILTENQFWPASFKVSIFSWRHLDQRRHGNHSSAFSYLLRVYNGNNRTVWNLFEVNIWHRSGVFIVNKFHTLFWCFHCWLKRSKYRLGNNFNFFAYTYLPTWLLKLFFKFSDIFLFICFSCISFTDVI